MGAIVAIIGDPGDPELHRRLERMLARSAYRGASEHLVENGLAIGIQKIADDASLARTETHIVAFHGFIGNWNDLGSSHGLEFRPGSTDAERMAVAFELRGEAIAGDLRGEFACRGLPQKRPIAGRLPGCRRTSPVVPRHRQHGRLVIATEIRQVLVGSEEFLQLSMKAPWSCTWPSASSRRLERYIRTSSDFAQARSAERRWDATTRSSNPPPSGPHLPNPNTARSTLARSSEETRHHLMRAVKRSIPAAPENYGLALSGGVDSSAIWALINRDLKERATTRIDARRTLWWIRALGSTKHL